MKFNTTKLEKLLKKTGLPYHSMPFIHGGLTALAIAPGFIDLEIEITAPCMVLFDVKPDKIPEMGINDPMFDDVLEYVDAMDLDIIEDVEGQCYCPFLGDKTETGSQMAMVREWCRGFMAVSLLVGVMPQKDVDNTNAAVAFGTVLHFSDLAEKMTGKESALLQKECEKDPSTFLADCVYEVNIFWSEKEVEYEEEELFPGDEFHDPEFGPVVRNAPKVQRNDPCPCGSGKKYKKCCGKDGESHPLDFPVELPGLKASNILEFPVVKQEKAGKKQCFICGKTKHLVKTPCCNQWICNDEDQYVLFSYSRNSCFRNHHKFTLCGYHFSQGHTGDWKTCSACRTEMGDSLEMYVWHGTNEYNHEILENPPKFKPTFCDKCKKRIVLPEGGYTMSKGKYFCGNCM